MENSISIVDEEDLDDIKWAYDQPAADGTDVEYFHKDPMYLKKLVLYKNLNNYMSFDNDVFKFEGQVEQERPHGIGIITWPNGKWFEGNFFEGKMNGLGKEV